MIDAEDILTIAPHCTMGFAVSLVASMAKWEINTLPRQQMFLAQCAHESEGFTKFEENLNYSAEGLMKTWPNRFTTFSLAAEYARKPEHIANFVYANRLGNGNEASGDGWKYRGRGAIQLTGKTNYRLAGVALEYPLERYPQDLVTATYCTQAACWFWVSKGLNALADAGQFDATTQRINGGQVGKDDRHKWWDKFKTLVGG